MSIYRTLITLSFLCSCSALFAEIVYPQNQSEAYKAIMTLDGIEDRVRNEKIDSLFDAYEEDGRLNELLYDLRHYAISKYRNRDIEDAISYLEKAASICQILVPYDENFHKRILFNLGLFNSKNNDFFKAIKSYKQIIAIGKEDDLSAEALSRIGLNYMHLGDFYNALAYHDQAKVVLSEREMYNELIIDRINASNAYIKIRQKALTIEGIKSLQRAEALNDSLKGTIRDRSYAIYTSLGKLLHDGEDLHYLGNALDYHRKALNLLENPEDSLKIASTLNSIGVLYMDREKKDSAYLFFEKAFSFSYGDKNLQSLISLNQADLALHRNQLEQALKLSEKGISLMINNSANDVKPEFVSTSDYDAIFDKGLLLESIKVRINIWKALFHKYGDRDHLNNAYQLLLLADHVVDQTRYQSIENESKLFWQEQATALYISGVHICHELGNIDKAFYFMEKNKAILLLEDLAFESKKSAAKLSENVTSAEFKLKNAIARQEEKLVYASYAKRDSIKNVLFRQKTLYAQFIDSLQSVNPAYHYFKTPANILEYELAKKEGTFIEYILPSNDTDAKGYILFSDGKTELLHEISEVKFLNKKINQYRELLSKPFRTEEDVANFTLVSVALYELLIPEVIREVIKGKKVIIIPDGNLQNVPFEALITKESEGQYLIESVEMSYAYSMSFSSENQSIERKPARLFLGFAPVYFNHNDLFPLKDSESEVIDIGQSLDGDIYVNDQAVIERFSSESNNYKIIHFATHADASDSISPWIAFSDTVMTIYDLYTIKTQAELVVLSACNTAQGELKTGEGVMSLARGFFYNGSNSVLSSLWAVNDQSSSQLIKHFYENLKSGHSKSASLRNAKLAYIKNDDLNNTSPYYWASYILMGDSSEIDFPNTNYILIGVFILLAALVLYKFWPSIAHHKIIG